MGRKGAILGATTLVIVGLGGPAHANSISLTGDITLVEIAVDLNSAGMSGDIDGTYVKVKDVAADGATEQLEDFALWGCTDSSGPEEIFDFGSSNIVPSNGLFLIANEDYANSGGPAPNVVILASENNIIDELAHSDGGVFLVPDRDTSDVRSGVQWGAHNFPRGCATPALDPDMEDANETPTSDQPISRDTIPPWSRVDPKAASL